ncbi:MAG: hypothetical protein HY800_06150 [Ignavibacteriales bacterium]|nr:hypothetical protein [Ignavibacteriales bacterium]
MKIVACINHVPDTEAKIKVGADGKSIDKAGVSFILNPYDEYAIEAALQLKEKNGGETIALTLGGDTHKESLRKALAMGIDKAIFLKDESPRDSLSVAKALAEELKKLTPDFIMFGKQSIDYYGEQLPGLVAEILGLPSVSQAGKIVGADAGAVPELVRLLHEEAKVI